MPPEYPKAEQIVLLPTDIDEFAANLENARDEQATLNIINEIVRVVSIKLVPKDFVDELLDLHQSQLNQIAIDAWDELVIQEQRSYIEYLNDTTLRLEAAIKELRDGYADELIPV